MVVLVVSCWPENNTLQAVGLFVPLLFEGLPTGVAVTLAEDAIRWKQSQPERGATRTMEVEK